MATGGYSWGWEQPPHPVSEGASGVVGLEPDQLPEVRLLVAEGWQLAPDVPMFAYLPAVWPAEWRTWVPDRSTRYEQRYVVDAVTSGLVSSSTAVASSAARDEVDDDTDGLLAEVGLPGRPRGRLWLLKPPPGFVSVETFLDALGRRADAAGIGAECSRQYVQLTVQALREAFDG